MIDEVFEVMKCFPRSYVNRCGECVLSDKGNVYFTAKGLESKTDIICKLLEWCSRPMAKGEPYSQTKRNESFREELTDCLNEYLGTSFTPNDMWWIYDQLGNAVNHELTLKFIESGFDMEVIYDERRKGK